MATKRNTRKKVPEDGSGLFTSGPDSRFVYIMKRTKGRSWYAAITFQSEYKIGIAKDPTKRNKEVDKAIKGTIEILRTRKVGNARKVEARLHRIFADSRFRIRSRGKGGGATEWFYMNEFEYILCEFWLWYYSIQPIVNTLFWGSIIIFFIYLYLTT